MFLLLLFSSSVDAQDEVNSGEEACEGIYNARECLAVGCCEWDDSACSSAVGNSPCTETSGSWVLGADNENCDDACVSAGLTCDGTEFFQAFAVAGEQNDKWWKRLFTSFGETCGSIRHRGDDASPLINARNGRCNVGDQYSDAATICSAVARPRSATKRACYCSPNPEGPEPTNEPSASPTVSPTASPTVPLCPTIGEPNDICVPGYPHYDQIGDVCLNDDMLNEYTCQYDENGDMVCRQTAYCPDELAAAAKCLTPCFNEAQGCFAHVGAVIAKIQQCMLDLPSDQRSSSCNDCITTQG